MKLKKIIKKKLNHSISPDDLKTKLKFLKFSSNSFLSRDKTSSKKVILFIAVKIDSLKELFELGSIKLKFNISPEGARFIKTFAIKDSLKEFGLSKLKKFFLE